MTTVDEHETQVEWKNFSGHIIPSKKFKTVTLELKLKTLIDRSTITKRAILPFVLRKGSKHYPTAGSIQNKLDDLYGASLQITGHKAGSYHVLTFYMEIPNEKFIQDEQDIIGETLAFLQEIAFQPNIENDSFDETVVAREKDTITKYLQSIKDEKMQYANIRLIDEMATGERYQIHSFGYLEDMDQINGENLYRYYKKAVENDQIDLFIVGDVDADTINTTIKNNLDGFRKTLAKETMQPNVETVESITHQKPHVVIEEDTIQQAKLHIGYRTYTAYKDSDFAGMILCNTILGGHPGAKLFKNVREKHSLAYYAASRLDFFSDKLFIFSGIAPEDYEKARSIIEEQIIALKEGEITDSEMEEAKTLISNQHIASLDHADGIIDLLYQQELGNKKRPVDSLLKQVKSLTKEDVVNSARKLSEDTIFLLTSKEDE